MEIEDYFPFNEFRPYQKETIQKCINEFKKGTEVIIIEGPTGFGKSPVNIALGTYFAPSYYTTPQKKLREQLGESFGPRIDAIDGGYSNIIILKARKDYICKSTDQDCEICKNRENDDSSLRCSNNPNCTYWKQKETLFQSEVGILTFSNLIVNSYLPLYTEKGKQISFEKRKLLIIDECHSLEEQVASLHAGFTITPNSFTKSSKDKGINKDVLSDLKSRIWMYLYQELPLNHNKEKKDSINWLDQEDNSSIEDLKNFLNEIPLAISKAIEDLSEKWAERKAPYKSLIDNEKYDSLLRKIIFMENERKIGKEWIVNLEYFKSWNTIIPHFKPIYIDNFLQQHIWKYGDKYLLTSATIPYRNNIQEWLNRIGLGNKSFEFISIPMFFPKENRPIYLDKIGGSLSYKNKRQNWNLCIRNVEDILNQYKNQQGVIHVSSYQMMQEISKSLQNKYSIFLHDKKKIKDKDIIQTWIKSKKKILISPSIFEGVDLKDDLCRFQILFKVPYANLNDKRVKYLLYKENDQEWYNNETMIKIVQAYGRAIRSNEDYADFYIIDGDFLPFYKKVIFPEWFKEAIVVR